MISSHYVTNVHLPGYARRYELFSGVLTDRPEALEKSFLQSMKFLALDQNPIEFPFRRDEGNCVVIHEAGHRQRYIRWSVAQLPELFLRCRPDRLGVAG